MTRARVDFAIVGGGIAGLWMYAALQQLGFSCVLIEANALGSGQTLTSQGIVHGGLKYALSAQLTPASEAAAAMPARWREVLASTLTPTRPHDPSTLQGLPVLTDAYYLLATTGLADRLVSFLASRSLHGRVDRVQAPGYPAWLAGTGFRGPVYRLNDFVVDTHAVLQRLAGGDLSARLTNPASSHILHADIQGYRANATHVQLQLHSKSGEQEHDRHCFDVEIDAQRLLLCAGAGNAALLGLAGRHVPAMQLRPLHQVWLRQRPAAAADPSAQFDPRRTSLPDAFAHCLSGTRASEPRLTITTHVGARASSGTRDKVWSLGGALATQGVHRTPQQQIEFTHAELAACVPWLNTADLQFATARIDRAEPHTTTRARPDHASVHYDDGVFTCWPTKLTLAPDMADRVVTLIQAQQLRPRNDANMSANMDALAHWPRPVLATPIGERLAWS